MVDVLTSVAAYVFYGAVMLFAVAELVAPRRKSTAPATKRWCTNIGLFFCGLLVQRFVAPVSALVAAEAAGRSGVGLLNAWAPSDGWVVALAGVAALDLWRYLEHRVLHAVPLLWRLHVTHHSDIETDFTTTERHHPLETIFVSASLVLAVVLIGISPLAVALYVVLSSAVAPFSHANVRLPEGLERALAALIVTPGVHNVHHSARRAETDSNFGTLSTLWDRLLGTYRAPDRAREKARVIGLEYFRDAESARLDRVLAQPFRPFHAAAASNLDRLPVR